VLRTPVAFLIFNRPDVTARVFAEIARARPAKLLVVADGARADRAGEAEACRETRAIVERVDWDCEVLTNFSEVNLGCRRRVSSGITWVFEQVEEAIILEDDCLPDPTFFPFCSELLERFRHDERVSMICGSNFLHGRKPTPDSYYFSRFGHIWGWASWRRAWAHYDADINLWSELRETSWLADTLGDELAARYWRERLDSVRAGEVDTWDYQWFFTWWAQNCLAAVADTNLITNIGFGVDATHTKTAVAAMSELPRSALVFPLQHPAYMARDREIDAYTFRQICPWAMPAPGLGGWLRRNVAPRLPSRVRESLSLLRAASRVSAQK
jgi:hypothetical protein